MNKFSKIASAALIALGMSAVAMAQTVVSTSSTVNGGSSSYTTANGVNQFSAFGAAATSQNQSNASAGGVGAVPVPVVGTLGPYYQATSGATTSTQGSTANVAGGLGTGSASAGADQSGTATASNTTNAIKPAGSFLGVSYGNGGNVGHVNTNSVAQIGTQSGTTINNTGAGAGGTNAQATNAVTASVSAPTSGQSNAVGGAIGGGTSTTWGLSTQPAGNTAGGTLTLNAGTPGQVNNVTTFQSGTYGGTITRP